MSALNPKTKTDLSAKEELLAGEELGLILHGLGLFPGGLHSLAVVAHRDHVQLINLSSYFISYVLKQMIYFMYNDSIISSRFYIVTPKMQVF